jgi:membrane protein
LWTRRVPGTAMARAGKTAERDGSPAREPAIASLAAEGPPGPEAGSLLATVWERWNAVDADRLAAAVAFYTVLSLAPFLILVVAVGSWWIGLDATRHFLSVQIAGLIGPDSAGLVERIVSGPGLVGELHGWAGWMGAAITAIGATATFVELQHALNRIFGEVSRGTIVELLRARVLSFGLVVGTGLLLGVSLVLSTALTLLVKREAGNFALRAEAISSELVSFVVIAIAFAALLRVLPDRPPRAGQVWLGAIASAVLFAAGKYVIGWYVAHFALGSAYGATGTVVVVMLWIYFSAATFLAGAVLASVSRGARYTRRSIAESPK